MKTLIVIPAFNEEDVIEQVILKMQKDIGHKENLDFIIVDDCSTDNTLKIIKKLNVKYLHHIVNLGIGSGFKTGIKWGIENGYTAFINFDADGQHDSLYIDDLIRDAKDYDFIVGSRYITKKRVFKPRQIGSYILTLCIRLKTLNKLTVSDPTSGFVCLTNVKIAKAYITSRSSYPEPSLYPKLLKENFKVKQISVIMHDRVNGESYFNFSSSILFMYEQIVMIVMGY